MEKILALFILMSSMLACEQEPQMMRAEQKSSLERQELKQYLAQVKASKYSHDIEMEYLSDVTCTEAITPSEEQIERFSCSEKTLAVCHVPKGNPENAHIITLSRKAYYNTQPNSTNNESYNYIVDCQQVEADLRKRKYVQCHTLCDDKTDISFEQPVVEEPVVEEPVVEAPVVEAPVVEAPVVEEPVIEQPVVEKSTPLYLDKMNTQELESLCHDVCGDNYRPEIRYFYQLRQNTYPQNVGLYCGNSERRYKGTACHEHPYYPGLHFNGLAVEKTELHGGSWARQRDAHWCIQYHERDLPYLNTLYQSEKIAPGQISCGNLVDNSSLGI